MTAFPPGGAGKGKDRGRNRSREGGAVKAVRLDQRAEKTILPTPIRMEMKGGPEHEERKEEKDEEQPFPRQVDFL